MAEEETPAEETVEGAEQPSSSKKGLFMGGGALSLVAIAGIGAMLAVPGDGKTPIFDGPFIMPLAFEGEAMTVNLSGEGKRFLVMDLKVEFDAYKEPYGSVRIADPLYLAKLQDTLLTIATQKTPDDVLEVGTQEIFIEQLTSSVEPLLFPVHIGDTKAPMMVDDPSQLRPGISIFESTMRDPLYTQNIAVDAPAKSLRLGDGEVYEYNGTEENLMLKDALGRTVYVNVTGIEPTFIGDVPVGVKGRVRNLYKVKFIIQ
ncbi:MAG: hypothetical protein ACI8TQ_000172 [Planctomycetota bacterium]|jgi:hypothetical protein